VSRAGPQRPGDERGAATVVVVALLGLLLVLGATLAVVGGIFAAHRRAQAAADLASLAGAAAAVDGRDVCGTAASVAAANQARLVSCVPHGREVRVTVAVQGPQWRGLSTGDLVGESRAGPAP